MRATGHVGDGRREAAEQLVVDRHEHHRREQQHLDDDEHGEAARAAAQPVHHRQRDDRARQRVRQPEPRQDRERDRRARDPADARQLAHAQRQQRRERQQRGGRQLGRDGRRVGERRRRQPAGERRRARPRLGHDAPRDRAAEANASAAIAAISSCTASGPPSAVGGRDQQREADPVRLVGLAVGQPAVALERVRVPVAVGARRVLVAQVDVAIADDRLGRQQVVGLVAAVLRRAERVQADRRGIRREQDEPDCGVAAHGLHDRGCAVRPPPVAGSQPMRGPLPRLVAIVVILAITFMLVSKILFGGPDFEAGKCVDDDGALVGCERATRRCTSSCARSTTAASARRRARSSTSSAAASTAASR